MLVPHHPPLLRNFALPWAPKARTNDRQLKLQHRQHGREARLAGTLQWEHFERDVQNIFALTIDALDWQAGSEPLDQVSENSVSN